jgi:hypothetical protein
MTATLVWIAGCATYYYVRFTWIFFDQYGDALAELWDQFAKAFAFSPR